jgi:hypothetical protein
VLWGARGSGGGCGGGGGVGGRVGYAGGKFEGVRQVGDGKGREEVERAGAENEHGFH